MPRQLLATYPKDTGRYDEAFHARGKAREHWTAMWERIAASSAEDLRRWRQDVERQIQENGVTYNVYADPRGADRPWELDILPLIIPHEEWQLVERAVAQRAGLLNRILEDCYGEQRLIREGALPAALIHGHPGFLRPLHGVRPPGGVFLHFYAVDLARSPDGQWWVMADRAEAPSGAGYAIENRLLVSQAFPGVFRELRVARLIGFLRSMRESLYAWAPSGPDAPLCVLLTPGPYNETYFEHAFLARYLGYPLVEANDLTVRGSRVFLKTLGGLKRVHAIVRRVDSEFLDPLELRSDSALGVTGLVQAVRAGNVLVANALGAGIADCAGLLGFLPGLSERLLGEPLALPSVATWWCGEPAAFEDVIAKLDGVVIKPVFPRHDFEPVFGEDLRDEARERLLATMREAPHLYVAQETVKLSQVPVIDRAHPRRLGARPVGLRVFAVATAAGGYRVMPGGLTRVAGDADVRVLSMQRGGFSKDTWVPSTGPFSSASLARPAIGPTDLVRAGRNLSSRSVENLFWFGRYSERCDSTARLLRITIGRMIDDADTDDPVEWAALLGLCERVGLLERAGGESPDLESALLDAVFDPEHPGGFFGQLRHLQRVAFQLRERMSPDNWRTVSGLSQEIAATRRDAAGLGHARVFLGHVVLKLMTLAGFALDGMSRDQGWRFLSMGRRLERLQFLCEAVSHAFSTPCDGQSLEWVLELGDCLVTYRSRYVSQPERLPVADLLLMDSANPRSLIFQAAGIHDYLGRLAEQFGPCGQDILDPPLAALREFDLAAALSGSDAPARLKHLLGAFSAAAGDLSDRIGLRFFEHIAERRRATYAF